MSIPRVLHYVWVGGAEKSPLMRECMATWQTHCPDYKVIEWNEKNFDMNRSPVLKNALETRNWALVSDIMRAYILYENGGIYLDTDIEIYKPLDELLDNKFFMGYETRHWVNTPIIGSVKGHAVLEPLIRLYNSPLGLELTNFMCVHIYSAMFLKMYGIRPNGKMTRTDEVTLYPRDYFFPQHYLTHKYKITKNSIVNHKCSCTWHDPKLRKKYRFVQIVYPIFGRHIFSFFEGITARNIRKNIYKLYKRLDKTENA